MKEKIKKLMPDKVILSACIALILTSFIYDGYIFYKMRDLNISLENQVATYKQALSITQNNLFKVRGEKDAILTILGAERQNNSYIQSQIQDITSTVGQLQKLSQTDVELLKKYSKVYFLNENYVPPRLSAIEDRYLNIKNKPLEILSDIYPKLKLMLDDAKAQGVDIQILSAYRSFSTQAGLKSAYKVTYGYGANKFSADQGYSEHQLGTTIDFTTPKIGSVLTGFEKTDAYKWLTANAYKYGFILSYPKNNTYYIYEPWHWRFVGVTLATRLHDQNLNFYDVSQRDIDQYLANIFD
ncbi:MAG: D-alanyl-D-alanine carboxypeptidase [Parcubacteria bacterium C7867-006]|nr:MAG: D-alanyl-D-alanine carboxypeptidase [Parcubacteria bacterium C7867-006]